MGDEKTNLSLFKVYIMKKNLFLIIIFSFLNNSNAQINDSIREVLIGVEKSDQDLRKILYVKKIFDSKVDSIGKANKISNEAVKDLLLKKINKLDSINLLEIENIIKKYGYPGTNLVGHNENNIAWSVIQHSNYETRKKYLPLLENAAKNKQLAFSAYATTLDRILMDENKPQIYGSQVKKVVLKGNNEEKLIFWPIENPKNINKIRRKAGFYEWKIKKYAKNFNIKYENITLDQIQLLK
ncbi:hypothetical protein OBJ68_08795 [Empedobacter falsenii]